MVREHEVFAAGVQVEGVAEELGCHGGTLDVPSGAAGAYRCLPLHFIGVGGRFGSFPESEIAGGVFVVLVDLNAGAILDAGEIFFGELAVLRKTGDAEIPGTVFRLVSQVLCGQRLDERRHLRDVLGRARDELRALAVERVHVFEESLLVARRVVADRHTGGDGVTNDLVIDVSNVHDMADRDALLTEEATQQIDMKEGPKVADVAVVVHGGAAGIHAENRGAAVVCRRTSGRKNFHLAGHGIEKANGHEKARTTSATVLRPKTYSLM